MLIYKIEIYNIIIIYEIYINLNLLNKLFIFFRTMMDKLEQKNYPEL
jgi:hypothetical protein